MWIFMLGFMFGGFFGMFLICLMQICRADRDVKTAKEYKEEIRTFIEYVKGIEKKAEAHANVQYVRGIKDVVHMYKKYFEEDL